MELLIPIIAIVSLFIVLPGMIFHYITEWKKARGFTAQDEAMLEDLLHAAQKMEDRVQTLERILDSEIPDWRSRHHD